MSVEELKAKYGRNKKRPAVINAAIRAEIVGGDDLLDALPLVDRLTIRLHERGLAGVDEAQAALDALRRCKDVMAGVIADRYGLDRV